MTWPPRWDGPQFKGAKTSRVSKRVARAKQRIDEDRNKQAVRRRDKRCRFPMCGCRKLKIQPHVAHLEHKGMGGNPEGDRSQPEKMILVCACRHRENAVSLDRGTLACVPLTADGTAGPVKWLIQTSEVPTRFTRHGERYLTPDWLELFREDAIGRGVPSPGRTPEILRWLASMEV